LYEFLYEGKLSFLEKCFGVHEIGGVFRTLVTQQKERRIVGNNVH